MVSVFEMIAMRLNLLDAAMLGIWLLAWTMFALCAAGIAQGKGHDGGGYFLLGLLLSPLVGLSAVCLIEDRRGAAIADLRARLSALEGARLDAGEPPKASSADMSEGEAEANLMGLVAQFLGWLMVIVVVFGGVWLFINQNR